MAKKRPGKAKPPVSLDDVTQNGAPVPSGWAFNPRARDPLFPQDGVASSQPNDANTEPDAGVIITDPEDGPPQEEASDAGE